MALLIVNLDKRHRQCPGMARHVQGAASRSANSHLARCGRGEGHRIPRLHASGFRPASRLPQPESHVQPFGRRGRLRQASETAEGPARQGGAAGRRSDDDGVRRHARPALPSRHARLPGGPGEAGMAQGTDHPARATARWFSGLRHDGQGAGAGLAVAGLQGLRVGPLAAAGRGGPDLPRPRSARAVSRPDRYRRLPVAADGRKPRASSARARLP